jgi:hypothetical protein
VSQPSIRGGFTLIGDGARKIGRGSRHW